MLRIRLHGRGGQGIKTGSRILGTAFFRAGFTVQDAPRYGAERRGAPMFAYVRANRTPINERGIIARPDLIVVADHSLVAEPSAGVLQGVEPRTVLVILSFEPAAVWQQRLGLGSAIVVLSPGGAPSGFRPGATCAGAAARLVGVIDRQTLEEAVRDEMAGSEDAAALEGAVVSALSAYDAMEGHDPPVTGAVGISAGTYERPQWVELPAEDAALSAPAIHHPATSTMMRTGLWRVARPVIDPARCHRCVWICGTFCPDNAITVDRNGDPQIDYDHCKGCLICVAQCFAHAIDVVPECPASGAGCLT